MYTASYICIYQSIYIYILRQKSFGQEKKASCDLSGFSFVYNRLHWKKGLLFHFKFVFPFFQAISMSFFSQLLKFHTKKKIQFIHNWTGTTHFYVMNCLFSRTSIFVEMIKNLTFRYLNINISSIGIKSFHKIYFGRFPSDPSIHPFTPQLNWVKVLGVWWYSLYSWFSNNTVTKHCMPVLQSVLPVLTK